MLFPKILFGTSTKVRGETRKLVTRLRRGETLEQILSPAEMVALDSHPKALIALGARWSNLGGNQFRVHSFSSALADDIRLSREDWNQFRDASLPFLAASAWGTLVLNTPQAYAWAYDLRLRPNRRAFVEILSSTTKYWDDFTRLGRRYSTGSVSGMAFDETLPLSGHLLAKCGITTKAHGRIAWPNIGPACLDANIVAKLDNDDHFWERVVNGDFPSTSPGRSEKPEAIRQRCGAGTADLGDWTSLLEHFGTGAIEAATNELEAQENWAALLFAFVHVLRDMESAGKLLLAHDSSGSELHWAHDLVVQKLEESNPALAAALLVQEAGMHLHFATEDVYRASANRLMEARAILTASNQAHTWAKEIAEFRARHSKLSQLIAALDELGLA